jgi:hypothetical protein
VLPCVEQLKDLVGVSTFVIEISPSANSLHPVCSPEWVILVGFNSHWAFVTPQR